MVSTFSRRRAIAIFAAVAGLPLLRRAEASPHAVTWKGQALGAPATLILHHEDKAKAAQLINRVVAEVSRLETVFSLYTGESALCELNRVGALVAPPEDMASLLHACRTFWQSTDGAFDPTIQPLWLLYRDHFSVANADPSGPSPAEITQTLTRIGFDSVKFNRDRIVLSRPNMGLTLNGVAQGYITDRIVELLREGGVTSSLVDMGENRAIGTQGDGRRWRIGLAESEDDERLDTILNVDNKAVATSSAAGFHFDDAERFGHILDPRSGRSPSHYKRMTVIANDATTADALSTAFSLMEPATIRSMVHVWPDVTVDLVSIGGDHSRFGAPV